MYSSDEDNTFDTDEDYEFALWDPLGEFIAPESSTESYTDEDDDDFDERQQGGFRFPFTSTASEDSKSTFESSLVSQETDENSENEVDSETESEGEYQWTLDTSVFFPQEKKDLDQVRDESSQRSPTAKYEERCDEEERRDEEETYSQTKSTPRQLDVNRLLSLTGTSEQPSISKSEKKSTRQWRKIRPVAAFKSLSSNKQTPNQDKASTNPIFSCMQEVRDEDMDAEISRYNRKVSSDHHHPVSTLFTCLQEKRDDSSEPMPFNRNATVQRLFSCQKRAGDDESEFFDNYSAIYDAPVLSEKLVSIQTAPSNRNSNKEEKSLVVPQETPALTSFPLFDTDGMIQTSKISDEKDIKSVSSRLKSLLCKKVVVDDQSDYGNNWLWQRYPNIAIDTAAIPETEKIESSKHFDSDFWESLPWFVPPKSKDLSPSGAYEEKPTTPLQSQMATSLATASKASTSTSKTKASSTSSWSPMRFQKKQGTVKSSSKEAPSEKSVSSLSRQSHYSIRTEPGSKASRKANADLWLFEDWRKAGTLSKRELRLLRKELRKESSETIPIPEDLSKHRKKTSLPSYSARRNTVIL